MNPIPPEPADLRARTIRELLAELARIEERLNSRRAAAHYHAHPEIARWDRQMRAIRAELQRRHTNRAVPDSVPLTDANEADRAEQLITVDSGPDEDYPHEREIDHPS